MAVKTIIQPSTILFLNPGIDDTNILFDHFCSDLRSILETQLETWKKVSVTCCVGVIYKISFDQNKIQHMKFYSKKCRLVKLDEIMEYILFVKQNLIAKMEMFSDSNDVNPYYILHKIEDIKVFCNKNENNCFFT